MTVKKTNKSEAIRALLKQGMSRPAIAKKLGVSPQLVYVVWSNANKGAKVRSKKSARVSKTSKPRELTKDEQKFAQQLLCNIGFRFVTLIAAYKDLENYRVKAK